MNPYDRASDAAFAASRDRVNGEDGMKKPTGANSLKTSRTELVCAEGTKRSLPIKKTAGIPTIRQLLGEDVALLSSTRTETELLDDAGMVLLAILTGLTENVLSGDTVYMSVRRAEQICLGMGMSQEVFDAFSHKFMDISQQARRKNPMYSMFEGM